MGKVIYITDEQKQKIVNLYLDGFNKTYIANELNISTQSVTKYLKKYGIPQIPHFLDENMKRKICDMYIAGTSQKEISRLLKVDERSINRVLKNAKINLRNASQANQKYPIDEHYFDVIDNQNKAYFFRIYVC